MWHDPNPVRAVPQPTLLRQPIELVVAEGEGTRAQLLRHEPFSAPDIEALGGLPAGYFAEVLSQLSLATGIIYGTDRIPGPEAPTPDLQPGHV